MQIRFLREWKAERSQMPGNKKGPTACSNHAVYADMSCLSSSRLCSKNVGPPLRNFTTSTPEVPKSTQTYQSNTIRKIKFNKNSKHFPYEWGNNII